MAFETVVFPQDPAFTYGCCNKDYFYSAWSNNNNNCSLLQSEDEEEKTLLEIINNNMEEQSLNVNNLDSSSPSVVLQQNFKEQWDSQSQSSPEACNQSQKPPSSSRRKRRRTRNIKNREEIENQRMTHITVERNRRKQMNDYLSVLRSLMPSSYVQRGDQASIIGGAINFVKELEHVLQSMEGQKRITKQQNENNCLFSEFFTFPQYTTCAETDQSNYKSDMAFADIEVTLVDSHANLKILSNKRRGNLMKIVTGIQNLGLAILHLNVTTVDEMVLYSVSLKVEEECQLSTVDEIAAAMNQLLRTVGGEVAFS